MGINEPYVNIPPMLSGAELLSALEIVPDYDPEIRNRNTPERLMELQKIYNLYLPSEMSVEIYSKLYLALIRSLGKKQGITAVKQRNQNYRAIRQQPYSGILGGSDSFTIIGASGIGKSTAISRAIELISDNRLIEIENPHSKVIPCLVVQCPFDSSVKGLLLEIMRKVDDYIGTQYYQNSMRVRATTDMLIGSVSQMALNHIGLLIVDEIQNVVNSKHGKSLVGLLTQLINNSGISICMVGTPECTPFFEQGIQLARRSLGMQYGSLNYNDYFRQLCATLFRYQYVRNHTDVTESTIQWLFEHSGGITSVVISLIHDAQEIGILTGSETLDIATLELAYRQRLTLLHGYIHPSQNTMPAPRVKKAPVSQLSTATEIDSPTLISDLASQAKQQQLDIVSLLRKNHLSIFEVVL